MIRFLYSYSILCIFILVNSGNAYAQNSKLKEFKKLFNSNTILNEEIESIENYAEEITDSIFNYFNLELLNNLNKLKDESDKIKFAKYYYFLGYISFLKEEDVESIEYSLKGISFLEGKESNYLSAKLNLNAGRSYSRIGVYTQSSSLFFKAIAHFKNTQKIFESQPLNYNELYSLYTMMGHAFHGGKDMNNAEVCYLKAKEAGVKAKNRQHVINSTINRGNLYSRNGKNEEALEITIDALQESIKHNYGKGRLYSKLNLSLIYNELGEYDKSLNYAKKAFLEADSLGNEHMKFRANQERAMLYSKLKMQDKAISFFLECLETLKNNWNPHFLKRIYQDLSNSYMENKDYVNASLIQQKYIRLNDSLNLADYEKKINLAESLYEQKSLNFKNKLLENENKLQESELKQSKLIILSSVFLLVFLVVFIIFQIKAINRYRKQSAQIKNQNEIISLQSYEIKAQNKDLHNYKLNLEKLVEQRTSELKVALEMANESNKLKTAFLENISHEIRTPLNAIVGFSQLAEYQDLEDTRKSLRIVIEQSFDLLNTVNEIVELAILDTRIQNLELSTLNSDSFNKRISNALSLIAKEEGFDNVDFILKLNPVELTVTTDVNKLIKALGQILENAFKFTETGEVVVESKELENKIEFKIKDTGIGISEEEIDNIFNVFHKIEGKRKLSRGIGLGLAIAKNLIESLSGEIKVKSVLGKGTSFYVSIPKDLLKYKNN